MLHSVTSRLSWRSRIRWQWITPERFVLTNVTVTMTLRRAIRAWNHWPKSTKSKLIFPYTGHVILDKLYKVYGAQFLNLYNRDKNTYFLNLYYEWNEQTYWKNQAYYYEFNIYSLPFSFSVSCTFLFSSLSHAFPDIITRLWKKNTFWSKTSMHKTK